MLKSRLICEETVDSDSNIVEKYIYTLGASGERIKVEELDRTVEFRRMMNVFNIQKINSIIVDKLHSVGWTDDIFEFMYLLPA